MSDFSNNDPLQKEVEHSSRIATDEVLVRDLLGDTLCDSESFVVVFSDPDLRLVYINPVALRLLNPNSVLGKEGLEFFLRDLISVEELNRFDSSIFPLLKVMGRWSGRVDMCDLWGSVHAMDCTFWNMASKGEKRGKFVCLQAHLIDDKSSSAANQAKDRDLLLALLGNSKDVIYFKDKNSRFLRVSLSLAKRFGLKNPNELIGRTDFEFFDMDHALVAYEDERRIIETGEAMLAKEEREIWDDGRVTWASTTKLPLLDSDGNVVGTVGVSRDITERKEAEQQRKELETKLRLAQRLEAIGSLAAGVAHEINTPTQFVSDNVRFLKEAFENMIELIDGYKALCDRSAAGESVEAGCAALRVRSEEVEFDYLKREVPETIEQTLEGLSQISRIVGSLREFSYPASSEKAAVDLNRAIENTVNVARNEWRYVADLKKELDPGLPQVSCLVDEINQVVLNLLVNAAHAIEAVDKGKGCITIRTTKEDGFACIEVEDTGGGIPPEIQDRLFDPFFTTKEQGKGTGQGLAMVRSIVVQNHGGQVDFDSNSEYGTVFRVRLPLEVSSVADDFESEGEGI